MKKSLKHILHYDLDTYNCSKITKINAKHLATASCTDCFNEKNLDQLKIEILGIRVSNHVVSSS
jgi:hypothetical protein